MKYNPDIHHRRSIRLQGYDYTRTGAYFVTICARGRECLFGDVVDGEVRLNDQGLIVADCWQWLAEQYPYVDLDAWIIMPNHFHGIIIITDDDRRGGSRTAPTDTPNRKPLGRLIGAFKTVSTKRINELRGTPGVGVWQRNYYEHVVRDDQSLTEIREYVAGNHLTWESDQLHPDNLSNRRGGRMTLSDSSPCLRVSVLQKIAADPATPVLRSSSPGSNARG